MSNAFQQQKFSQVMQEFGQGTLKHGGTGTAVPKNRPDIAKAIAASESGMRKKKKRNVYEEAVNQL